jgi:hypothetical protein
LYNINNFIRTTVAMVTNSIFLEMIVLLILKWSPCSWVFGWKRVSCYSFLYFYRHCCTSTHSLSQLMNVVANW